jgi:hypothetical protein
MPPEPPSAEMIAAAARAHYGVAVSPERAGQVAGEVAKLIAAIDRAAARLAFEDEPALFARMLREQVR